MMSLAARALSVGGSDVLVLDPTGTGDSQGDFADARLETWRDDFRRGAAFLQERGNIRLDVLAVRGGALLTSAALLPEGMQAGRLALWQPVDNGRRLAAQFLRLRVAETVVDGAETARPDNAREALRAAGAIEIAGYRVSEELIASLEELDLSNIASGGWQSACWFEVAAADALKLSPASQKTIDGLRARGLGLSVEVVSGDPFWATPEVAVVDALVSRTAALLGPLE